MMTRHKRWMLPVGLLLSAAAALEAEPSPSRSEGSLRPWTVCMGDATAPPFVTGDSKRPGLSERVLIDAGRQVGLQVQLLRWPSNRCRDMLRKGQIDAAAAAPVLVNLEAGQFPMLDGHLDRQRRLTTLSLVWVKRSDAAWTWDGHQFQPNRSPLVGLRTGFKLGTTFAGGLGVRIESGLTRSDQILRMLTLGRIDLALMIREKAQAAIAGHEHRAVLSILPQEALTSDFYAPVSRHLDSAAMAQAQAWWDEIGRLRDLRAYRP